VSKFVSVVAGALVTTVLVAGCSSPDEGADARAQSAIDVSVTLDEENGTIVLPYDRFIPDRVDASLLQTAQQVVATLCAREQGVGFMTGRFVEIPTYRSEPFYGPWTLAQAERYGFVSPFLTDADLRANGIVPEDYGSPSLLNNAEVAAVNEKLTDEDRAVVEECYRSPERAEFTVKGGGGPWDDELRQAEEPILAGETLTEPLDELYACYRERGLEPDTARPGLVVGADPGRIDEEQVALAVQTVECKQETDFTRRVADALAAAQAEVLLDYADEVVAQGEELQRALDAAQRYVAAHPEAFEPPA